MLTSGTCIVFWWISWMSNYDIQVSYEYNYEWYTIYIHHRYTMLYIMIMLLMNVTFNMTSKPVEVEMPNKNDDVCQQANKNWTMGIYPTKGMMIEDPRNFLAQHTTHPRLGHEKWWTFQPKHSEKSCLYVDEAGANFDIPTFFDWLQLSSLSNLSRPSTRWRIVRKLAVFCGQQVGDSGPIPSDKQWMVNAILDVMHMF